MSPVFPKVQADSLPSEPPGKPLRMFKLACDVLGLGGGGGEGIISKSAFLAFQMLLGKFYTE